MILVVFCTRIQCIIIICFCSVWKIYPLPSYLIVLQSGPGNDDHPACGVFPSELTGPSGEFGISQSQYKNDAQCRWKIRVESGKVITGSVSPAFIHI